MQKYFIVVLIDYVKGRRMHVCMKEKMSKPKQKQHWNHSKCARGIHFVHTSHVIVAECILCLCRPQCNLGSKVNDEYLGRSCRPIWTTFSGGNVSVADDCVRTSTNIGKRH